MSVKTVSLKQEAYDRLRSARRYPGESFSEVILRARWDDQTVTGAQLLERYRLHGPMLTDQELDDLEAVTRSDQPPADKWTRR
jgi:predicted CopG family antitoxin